MTRFPHRVFRSLLFLLVLLTTLSVQAQLGVALKATRNRFLRYEPIELTVTLRNYSGNTLTFSKEGPNRGHLFFRVDSHAERLVKERKHKGNPTDGLVLNAGETKAVTVLLNNFFDLQRPGSYTVRAQVGHARLSNDYQSEDVTFEVREGVKVITRQVGLPGTDSSTTIKAMNVSLVLFQDDDKSIYCLRVEDDNLVYATLRLGRQISSSEPEMDADAASDIHILIQVRSRLYSYAVYSIANGNVKLRQQRYYLPDGGVPHLTRAPGYIKVINAKQAVEGVDYELDAKQRYQPKDEE
jgi:hypothetical protein